MAAHPILQLGLSASSGPSLELRRGGDRRRGERRAQSRGGGDRRQGSRRRTTLRSVLLATLTLGFPQHLNPVALVIPLSHVAARTASAAPAASVTTTIESFVAVPPWRAYNALIAEAAVVNDIDPALIRSVMQAESAFNPVAVSRAGAMGLMQLMPELAEELGVDDPFDPRQNIMAGARYLRFLLDIHDGNVRLAVASYNAGPGAVARYGTVPPFRETHDYVKKVTHLLARPR